MVEFGEGDPVMVYAKAFYREKRIGLVKDNCPDHDGAIRVYMIDPEAPIKIMCVDTSIGDTIERLENYNKP